MAGVGDQDIPLLGKKPVRDPFGIALDWELDITE
jgi:hypothetical protein